jgi:hypothetical protein
MRTKIFKKLNSKGKKNNSKGQNKKILKIKKIIIKKIRTRLNIKIKCQWIKLKIKK